MMFIHILILPQFYFQLQWEIDEMSEKLIFPYINDMIEVLPSQSSTTKEEEVRNNMLLLSGIITDFISILYPFIFFVNVSPRYKSSDTIKHALSHTKP